MSKLEVGKVYKAENGEKVLIVSKVAEDIFDKIYRDLSLRDAWTIGGGGEYLGISEKGKTLRYDNKGRANCSTRLGSGYPELRLRVSRTITIDGKDIDISEESFKALKESLNEVTD